MCIRDRLIIVCGLMGSIIALIERSGGSYAFGEWLSKKAKTRNSSLIWTCLLYTSSHICRSHRKPVMKFRNPVQIFVPINHILFNALSRFFYVVHNPPFPTLKVIYRYFKTSIPPPRYKKVNICICLYAAFSRKIIKFKKNFSLLRSFADKNKK